MRVLKKEKFSSGCFFATCLNSVVKIRAGSTEFQCNKLGESFKVEDYEIICPDVADFCNKEELFCENDCSSSGLCLADKTCFCNHFYQGLICNIDSECNEKEQFVCDSLKKPFFSKELLFKMMTAFNVLIIFS